MRDGTLHCQRSFSALRLCSAAFASFSLFASLFAANPPAASGGVRLGDMASSAASLAKMCQKNGLCKAFFPQDLRYDVCRGLWPSEEMIEDKDACVRAIKALNSVLVSDSYGGVDAVRWARDVYNSRPGRSRSPKCLKMPQGPKHCFSF